MGLHDEYTDEQIVAELARRHSNASCGLSLSDPVPRYLMAPKAGESIGQAVFDGVSAFFDSLDDPFGGLSPLASKTLLDRTRPRQKFEATRMILKRLKEGGVYATAVTATQKGT